MILISQAKIEDIVRKFLDENNIQGILLDAVEKEVININITDLSIKLNLEKKDHELKKEFLPNQGVGERPVIDFTRQLKTQIKAICRIDDLKARKEALNIQLDVIGVVELTARFFEICYIKEKMELIEKWQYWNH